MPESVIAQLVIQDEGDSPNPAFGRRWSLNFVLQGEIVRIGRMVNGRDVKEAAKQFAAQLMPSEHP
jgi:hypothetical protein